MVRNYLIYAFAILILISWASSKGIVIFPWEEIFSEDGGSGGGVYYRGSGYGSGGYGGGGYHK